MVIDGIVLFLFLLFVFVLIFWWFGFGLFCGFWAGVPLGTYRC